MDLEEYEALPDAMGAEEVAALCMRFLKEDTAGYTDDAIEKMHIICDKQWHTYELPTRMVQEAIGFWVNDYFEVDNFDPQLAAKIIYCFGLEKKLLRRVVMEYGGVGLKEYEQDLECSDGEFIDPYWSLRD